MTSTITVVDRCPYADPRPGDVFVGAPDRSWASFKILGPVERSARKLWIEPIRHGADTPEPERVWIYRSTVNRYRYLHTIKENPMHTTTLTRTVVKELPIAVGDLWAVGDSTWTITAVDPEKGEVKALSSILGHESTYRVDSFIGNRQVVRRCPNGTTKHKTTEEEVEVKHRFAAGDIVRYCEGGSRLEILGVDLNSNGVPCYRLKFTDSTHVYFEGEPIDMRDAQLEPVDLDAELLATARFKVGDVVDPFGKRRHEGRLDPHICTRKGTVSKVFVHKLFDGSREVRYRLAGEGYSDSGWHLREATLLPKHEFKYPIGTRLGTSPYSEDGSDREVIGHDVESDKYVLRFTWGARIETARRRSYVESSWEPTPKREHVRVYTITIEAPEPYHPAQRRYPADELGEGIERFLDGRSSSVPMGSAGQGYKVTAATSEVVAK